mmetsp:Transcript_13151/g.25877  ORF Transcript_13151/g.25877 Transcript_13151/m.25877 type:complete len:141 (-) Transcript_13151:52-474(-)
MYYLFYSTPPRANTSSDSQTVLPYPYTMSSVLFSLLLFFFLFHYVPSLSLFLARLSQARVWTVLPNRIANAVTYRGKRHSRKNAKKKRQAEGVSFSPVQNAFEKHRSPYGALPVILWMNVSDGLSASAKGREVFASSRFI